MSFLSGIFGKKQTPEQKMKEYKRGIDKTVRELERERSKLQSSEKRIIADMRKAAKAGQMDSCRIMAKDLVRTRSYATKFYKMKAQLSGISLRLQTLNSTAQMANAMKGVTRSMKMMNARMNTASMMKIMQEFEMENEKMGMKEEMMNDAVDTVMDDECDEEEETEAMVQQVLDEIGLDFNQKVGVSSAQIGEGQPTADTDALQARLDSLRPK